MVDPAGRSASRCRRAGEPGRPSARRRPPWRSRRGRRGRTRRDACAYYPSNCSRSATRFSPGRVAPVRTALTVSDQRLRPRKEPRQPRGHETAGSHPRRRPPGLRRPRLRGGDHQPHRRRGRAVHRLALPVLPQQGRHPRPARRRPHRGRHRPGGGQVAGVLAAQPAGPPAPRRAGGGGGRRHGRGMPPTGRLHRVLFEEAPRPPELLARSAPGRGGYSGAGGRPAGGSPRGGRARRGAGREDGGRHGRVVGPPHRHRQRVGASTTSAFAPSWCAWWSATWADRGACRPDPLGA